MSHSYIPERVKVRLWGKAAGRCQYEGCNTPLWLDSLTKEEMNKSYIAHIIADKQGGPRGDAILSEKLNADISNLMLMCDEHHRRIDRDDVLGHPVERLVEMKNKHEQRVGIVTSMTEDLRSHVLLYSANIGHNGPRVTMGEAMEAMSPNRYPVDTSGLELGWNNSMFYDDENHYWQLERENLRRQFNTKVRHLINNDVKRLSVFGIAPQPLLIELGRLISDIPATDVYQKHREPSTWKWRKNPNDFTYIVNVPEKQTDKITLNLSLSATIDNERIMRVLGEDVSIWTMTIPTPNNDFLKSKEQLQLFRKELRLLLDLIKKTHGHENKIHIFPAVPVAIAIEIGRVWMPKADLPLSVYDENRALGGFNHAFDISHETAKMY